MKNRYVDTILSKYQQKINVARKILLFRKDWFSMRDFVGYALSSNAFSNNVKMRLWSIEYGRTKKD